MKNLTDKREQVEVFLDQFLTGYHGSTDVVHLLEFLILHIRQYPSLQDVQPKLEWLKRKKNLEKKFFALCEDREMSAFLTYVKNEIPQHEDCSHIDQHPDDFHKLVHLMNLVLKIPKYYSAFKTYCESKPELHKYITEDVSFTNEMIGYVSTFLTLHHLTFE